MVGSGAGRRWKGVPALQQWYRSRLSGVGFRAGWALGQGGVLWGCREGWDCGSEGRLMCSGWEGAGLGKGVCLGTWMGRSIANGAAA
jgi:hypothetical protein